MSFCFGLRLAQLVTEGVVEVDVVQDRIACSWERADKCSKVGLAASRSFPTEGGRLAMVALEG